MLGKKWIVIGEKKEARSGGVVKVRTSVLVADEVIERSSRSLI